MDDDTLCFDVDYDSLLVHHEGSQWMYFTSKPQCEMSLYKTLRALEIPCYLPCVRKTTEYSHRVYTRVVPMFKGYVFASTVRGGFDMAKINSVVRRCCFLDPWQSDSLLNDLICVRKYEVLAQKHKVNVLKSMKPGMTVLISHGCFKGEYAMVTRINNHDEITVQLSALPMALSVQMPIDFLGIP